MGGDLVSAIDAALQEWCLVRKANPIGRVSAGRRIALRLYLDRSRKSRNQLQD